MCTCYLETKYTHLLTYIQTNRCRPTQKKIAQAYLYLDIRYIFKHCVYSKNKCAAYVHAYTVKHTHIGTYTDPSPYTHSHA